MVLARLKDAEHGVRAVFDVRRTLKTYDRLVTVRQKLYEEQIALRKKAVCEEGMQRN